MKVLQITNTLLSGGAEKLIVDTAKLYIKKNIDVDILLLDGTKTPFIESLASVKKISIFSLGNRKNIYNPFNSFKIIKYFKNYDIIHVHLFPAIYWVAFAKILTKPGCKIVMTEHNSSNRRRDKKIFKILDKLVYKQFDRIITISNAVDINLKKHLGNHFNNFIKINNGIDLKIFNNAIAYSKEELEFNTNDKLILQVSSFTPQKDQETLIRVMQKLPNNCKLLLVGQGPLEEKLKTLTNELGLANKVFFLGIRSDVPRLLKSVDIVVLSSNYEGLSLSSVEGMASGKPFLASDAPGLTEVVENAGILFPPKDIEKLKEHIINLLNDSKLYLNTSQKCIQRAKKFDVDIMVENHINLYDELLEKNN